jgi:hypothetical protein
MLALAMELVKLGVLIVFTHGIQTTQSLITPNLSIRHNLSSYNHLLGHENIRESATSLNHQRGDGSPKSERESQPRPRRIRYKGKPSHPQQRRSTTKVEVANRQYKEKRQRDKLQRLFTKLLEKDRRGDALTRE